jgi:tetratricopeptide (TPR) repeat protein
MKILYYRYALYSKSLQYAIEELDINKKIYDAHHQKILDALKHVASCYYNLRDYPQAFNYMTQVLAIYQSNPNSRSFTIYTIERRIDEIVQQAAKNHIKLPWQITTKSTINKPTKASTTSRKSLPLWAMPKSKALRQAFGFEITPDDTK